MPPAVSERLAAGRDQRICGGIWKRLGNNAWEMENWPMLRTVVVVGTLLLGVGVVAAQQDLVKHAQTFMKGNGKNAGALGAMVKGEKPYDQAAVDAALAQFEDTAKKLPTLFPASIKGHKAEGDYSASAKVWEDKAGFEAHIVSFSKVVTEAKAKIKDLDTLKATFPVIGKECGGCHETYRVKNG
jgi:cytochrome c556